MANAPGIGGGGRGVVGPLPLAKKDDGTDAIFTSSAARDAYYRLYQNLLVKLEAGSTAVGIGTPDKITAAYVRRDKQWVAIATNFKGNDGRPGKPGAGVDLTSFKDGEVPVVDHATNSLVESGVFAGDGEVKVEPDSIIIGSHEWSSSAENMTVTNLVSGTVYAPLWQEVAPGADESFLRAIGMLEPTQLFTDQSRVLTNPVFRITPTHDETVFSVEVVAARAMTNVLLSVYDGGKKIYRCQWTKVPVGTHVLKLKTPSDFKANKEYEIHVTSKDGDAVLRGGTDGNPRLKVNLAKWVDKKIATEEFVLSQIKGGTQPLTPLTAEDISKAVDHGEYTGSGSIKGLDYGWWVIKAANTGVTGRPSGSKGDLIVFKNSVKGMSSKSGFSVMLAFGKDSTDKNSIWAEYRDGSVWTPWFKVTSDVDLSPITTAVSQLEYRSTIAATDIATLKTEVGDIYAPNKVAFDSEVNALIEAKVKELSGGTVQPKVLPRIYALFSNSIPSSLSIQGMVTSTNGRASLTRTDSTNTRVCVMVENDNGEADRVTGFSVDDGAAASWVPRDTVIGGKKYRAFFSAGAYTETSLNVKVNFK